MTGGASLDTFFPKNLPRDAYAPRGWRIDASREETRLPRQIVFTPRSSARQPRRNTPARFRLKHQQRRRRPVARPVPAVGHVQHHAAARGRDPGQAATGPGSGRRRSDGTADARISPRFYRTVATSLKPVRDRMAALQKELKALGIPTALVMRERNVHERPSAYVRRRGSFLDKGSRSTLTCPPPSTRSASDQMPNRLGLAHWLVDERESAHGARRGQSRLGAVLRPRHRRNERRLRHAGNAALAPGAARLAGDGVRGARAGA